MPTEEIKLTNPNGPKTKADLWAYVKTNIEQEGFDYALVDYTSPEYTNCDELDPELAALWREYLALVKKINGHVGIVE